MTAKARRIEDFGEEIPGAAKHRARARIAEMFGRATGTTVAQIWPTLPYAKLLEDGVDPSAVAYARAAREVAMHRCRRGGANIAAELGQWRDRALAALESDSAEQVERIVTAHLGEVGDHAAGDLVCRMAVYRRAGHDRDLSRVWFDGTPPGSIAVRARGYYTICRFGSADDMVGAFADPDARLRSFIERRKPREDRKDRNPYVVLTNRQTGEFSVGRKGPRGYVSLVPVESRGRARAMVRDERGKLDELWTKWRGVTDRDLRPAERSAREGPDATPVAVTPEEFEAIIPLRGVQFGNYVEGARRERDLADATQAFADLAKVAGCPVADLALGRRLALAFGARGRGGRNPANAHYEPVQRVINLTKNNAPGTLAHEWWHAADNMMAAALSGRANETGFATDAADASAGAVVGAASATRLGMEIDAREVADAASDLLGSVTRQTGLFRRSRLMDRRRSKPYWSTPREVTARAFEAHVVHTLAGHGIRNDYLAAFVDSARWLRAGLDPAEYPYPHEDEIAALAPAWERALPAIMQGIARGPERREPARVRNGMGR